MAFSSLTLPGIFSNIAHKSLLEGFLSVDTEWKKIVKFGSVNNFHTYHRYRMTADFKFEKIGADGEMKHGQLGEEHYTQQIETYAKMFSITRKDIINDDLGALSDIPRYIGIGAADTINDLVWQTFLNSKTSDGKTLFHADHKNLLPNTDLDIDGLTAAELAFSLQERSKGRPLGIRAKYLLVPISLKVAAEVLMKSLTLDGATVLSGNVNPHSGKFEIVSSSYLQAASFAGSSDKNWFLLADPNRLPVLEIAFLSGKQNPTIERADADFNTLGIQFAGFHDFGVSPQDYRGVLKVTPPTA
jgi:phage major head subunit gpT-like protein